MRDLDMPASIDSQRRLLESAKRAEDLARHIAAEAGRDTLPGNPEAVERARRARIIVDRAEELRMQVEESLARAEAAYAQAWDGIRLSRAATAQTARLNEQAAAARQNHARRLHRPGGQDSGAAD
ncbi:hypothetical protein [Azospirillum sp.]|uniref:hypothetical protein n=1 Tax=Azospirillum sp. TaxID=34012 RepID=UPI003D753C56